MFPVYHKVQTAQYSGLGATILPTLSIFEPPPHKYNLQLHPADSMLSPLYLCTSWSVFPEYLLPNPRDSPSGSVIKNPPANAGDTDLISTPRRSHMLWSNQAPAPQLLSLCSRAHVPQLLKPVHLKPVLCTAMRSPHTATKRSPHSLQLEKACASQQRPSTTKNKGLSLKTQVKKINLFFKVSNFYHLNFFQS